MKKLIAFALSATIALSLAACGNSKAAHGSSTEASAAPTASGSVQLPNPFTACESLEAAAALAGFEVLVPDAIDSYDERTIRAMANKMIEIIYSNGEQEIRIRKATGTADISGDFNEYAENSTADLGTLHITLRGSDQKINVATWTAGSNTFSLSMSAGMTGEDVLLLVEAIR